MVKKVAEEEPPIMTIDEVAQYLHLHPLTVRRRGRDTGRQGRPAVEGKARVAGRMV